MQLVFNLPFIFLICLILWQDSKIPLCIFPPSFSFSEWLCFKSHPWAIRKNYVDNLGDCFPLINFFLALLIVAIVFSIAGIQCLIHSTLTFLWYFCVSIYTSMHCIALFHISSHFSIHMHHSICWSMFIVKMYCYVLCRVSWHWWTFAHTCLYFTFVEWLFLSFCIIRFPILWFSLTHLNGTVRVKWAQSAHLNGHILIKMY